MFQVVDREFYREELNQIITTQKRYQNSLSDENIFEQCVKTLYPKNKNHREALLKNKKAIQHLLVEDILLYQRPLKTKKSEVANCKYEIRYWKNVKDKKGNPVEETDTETGEIKQKKESVYRKVVPASHPYFQEFRIWDKIHNLKLIQLEKKVDGKLLTNQDVTKDYFKSIKEYQELFKHLNSRKSLSQEQFLTYCKKKFKIDYKKKDSNYAWNLPEDEEIKGNETRVSFATRFKRCGFTKGELNEFLTQEKERELWHYLYSISFKERKAKNNKSATNFFNKYFKYLNIDDEVKEKIIKDFVNYPKFSSRYCAYSEKVLKKLLPLIRLGERDFKDSWLNEKWYSKWKSSLEERKSEILNRLNKINFEPKNDDKVDFSKVVKTNVDLQKGEIPFPKGLFNAFRDFEKIEDFKNLNLTQASYLVYGRHSELAFAKQWESPKQIRDELHKELKQHSLNNPVAEKVILEMMQVVADIWDYYGDGKEKFFSRIHLEVGRELKQSVKEKEKKSKMMSENRLQNKRIRQVLEEFLSYNPYNANPISPDHFERLKILEEGAEHTKNTDKEFFKDKSYSKKDIEEILKKPHIIRADFEKYKLWIEQGYKSPYSNLTIKITDLFNGNKYNVDHVFPQASITNNSLSNKVVCETEINKIKSNQTGRDFVNNPKQREIYSVAHDRKISIVKDNDYVSTVKNQFSGTKRLILLSKEIPKGFTNSQMNNARYISRKAIELLSHIVRKKGEIEFRSKNVLPVTGRITNELKRAWKLEEVWKGLVAPRYIRLNKLTHSNLFGEWQTSKSGQRYFDCNLDDCIREKDESYDIKRIDHRHHALDALVVALCTEEHVHYLNNINANKRLKNYADQKKLENYRLKLKKKIMWSAPKKTNPKEKNWYYMMPGEIRQKNTENSSRDFVLEKSYFYKTFNSYGQDYKKIILDALQNTIVTFKQNLRVINKTVNRYNKTPYKNKYEIQNTDDGQKQNWAIRRSLGKDMFYGRKNINGKEKIVIRKELDTSFNSDKIKTITDTGIQKILLNHLEQFDTVQLPFEEAINYFYAILEKQEFESIINDDENEFQSVESLTKYLKENNYKLNKTDYSKLNVFIEKVFERNFKSEKQFQNKINEHPTIAFSSEEIEEMNKAKNLQKLNDGKDHAPIRKVRIFKGFGNQRALNEEDKKSVKSKQYIVNDAGSNLYLGFYDRIYQDHNGKEVNQRKFKDIGLMELIETLKQDKTKRLNPLPDKIYDDNLNGYDLKFTLSPLDLVYVPTEDEIEKPSEVNFNNLTKEQTGRIYKYVDGNEYFANFIPYKVSKPIWRFHGKKNKEIFKELDDKSKIVISEKELIQNEFGLGSQQNKSQNMIDGKTQIKKICWYLKVDRLGNIKKIIK